MRKFIFVSIAAAFIASSSFAKGPNNPANFETAKAHMSEMADKRMSVIKEFKSCVDASANIDALKECRKKEADAMKDLRPKNEPRNDANNPPRGQGSRHMM